MYSVNKRTARAHGDKEQVEVKLDARLLEFAKAFADERGLSVEAFVPEILNNEYEQRK